MPRFFIGSENVCDGLLYIRGDDARHIARSLRMAVGDALTVCSSDGPSYECVLTKIRDEECECKICGLSNENRELPVEVTLFMAYPKGDKLETVVQKTVELGVLRIIPFESSRCIKRPSPEKAEKQTARLSRIAEEAAKQCGRSRLPEICPGIKLSELREQIAAFDLALLCYENERTLTIKEALNGSNPRSIALIIGCEGGFSHDEAAEMIAAGATCVGLGPRILRCETAPTYAMAAISYRFEL